jgi:glycerate kinase
LLLKTDILLACDVDSPLLGPAGASAVFGPQKGASPAMVAELDAALARYADVVEKEAGRRVRDVPGAGAAGGLGAAFLLLAGARLRPGADIVFEVSGLEADLAGVDLVLTGEGQTDFQTARGKAPVRLARLSKKYGKPVVCISGALGQNAEAVLERGVDALGSAVCSVVTLEEAMQQAGCGLEEATARCLRLIRLGMSLGVPSGASVEAQPGLEIKL